MVSRFVRTALALAIPVALLACSSASPENSSSQSESALNNVRCQPGLSERWCDTFEGPRGDRVVCTCEPLTGFREVASAPASGRDTCGTTPVAVPPQLLPYGCTTGVMVDDEPVWLCPLGTPLPLTLGVVVDPRHLGPMPVCVFNGNPKPINDSTCEAVEDFTRSSSNCLGTAPGGWMFILDTYWIPINGGGCAGQCAMPTGPDPGEGFTHGP